MIWILSKREYANLSPSKQSTEGYKHNVDAACNKTLLVNMEQSHSKQCTQDLPHHSQVVLLAAIFSSMRNSITWSKAPGTVTHSIRACSSFLHWNITNNKTNKQTNKQTNSCENFALFLSHLGSSNPLVWINHPPSHFMQTATMDPPTHLDASIYHQANRLCAA